MHIWLVHLSALYLSTFSYSKMSFSYNKISFQIFFISQNDFLILNACILNVYKSNTLLNTCISKCTKNYIKIYVFQNTLKYAIQTTLRRLHKCVSPATHEDQNSKFCSFMGPTLLCNIFMVITGFFSDFKNS